MGPLILPVDPNGAPDVDGNGQVKEPKWPLVRWVVIMLVAAGLSGCAGAPVQPVEEEVDFEELDLEAGADTGIIRGIVVDASITPIEGATVRVAGLERETLTNANGAFGFDDLEPGTYFLEANKLGFSTVQQSAEVIAGIADPPVIKFSLAADPSQLPWVLELQWDGYMFCGLSAIALCGLPVVNEAVNDEFLTVFELENDGVDYLQSEMIWDTTQTISRNMQLWQEGIGEGGCTFEAQNGPSPNVINTTWGDYNTHGDRDCFERLGNTTDLRLRVFSGSIDGTFPPTENGCYPVVGLCMGVGATLEQEFQVFNHLFYGFKPFEFWQFSIDGTPDPPV